MSAPPRIHLVIDKVAVTGLGSRDARRLVDAMEREIARLAPEIATAARDSGNLARMRRDGGALPAPARIEQAGAALARAIVDQIGKAGEIGTPEKGGSR
ncbi:hypothetical protein MWN34_00370 [Ancylobacter sp. 6x-1]|uniref:Uncharacterized protein n=1 Tax=Ancylobacter crimeensis TaxID=2579147 RepID=A0ABT0D5Y6_9HYPH|nr:hypothetical protein [Ancylobacter crimeensis]MCK0195358.1 hypothetical protein [Ancylobacter crimeensis]